MITLMTELEYAEFITPSWTSIAIFAVILLIVYIKTRKYVD